jgi:thiol-disulfide isomerase/thioredoxin
MLPVWEKQEKVFSLDHSEIFATREDFLAVIEFSRALKALSEDKRDDFKKHITEALWLSPGQASAFTPYIESLRLSEHIKNTRVDFAGQVLDLEKQNPIALKSLLAENRALLLHFWSPWSPDCETSMMDLSNVSPSLNKEKVALASILVDGRTEILAEAKEFLKGQDTPVPGPQLLDRSKDSLAAQLRVTDLPTVVLLGTDGKILFHGKPSDEKLLEKIKQLPPQKEQP